MKKRRRIKAKKRLQLLTLLMGVLLCIGIVIQISATKIEAESDVDQIRYKYYKSYYVEAGDSLWSIAREYMTGEYRDTNAYIEEVKQINHLKSSEVRKGTYLCIPYYSMEHK